MKQRTLRYLRSEDQKEFLEVINRTPKNDFDPDILSYPTLRVLHSVGAESVFLPVHQSLMLESLGTELGMSPLESAQGIRDLVKGAQLHASGLGIRELYFLATEDGVRKIAEGHGFTRVETPVLRLKL